MNNSLDFTLFFLILFHLLKLHYFISVFLGSICIWIIPRNAARYAADRSTRQNKTGEKNYGIPRLCEVSEKVWEWLCECV